MTEYTKADRVKLQEVIETLAKLCQDVLHSNKPELVHVLVDLHNKVQHGIEVPYTPMTDDELVEELYNTPDYSYLPEDCGYERHYELTAIARYNQQRGVK